MNSNHRQLLGAVVHLTDTLARPPTVPEIAQRTGLAQGRRADRDDRGRAGADGCGSRRGAGGGCVIRDLICPGSHRVAANALPLQPHTFRGVVDGVERWECACGIVRVTTVGGVTTETTAGGGGQPIETES